MTGHALYMTLPRKAEMENYPSTPELDRMSELGRRYNSQSVGAFLDWLLSEAGYRICEWLPLESDPVLGDYVPIRHSINQWLHEWLDIDAEKCESERQAVLDHIRETAYLKT